MAFRMGGLFIQARVENGLGTFEIGANNVFTNCLNSITVDINSGLSSEITLELTPTFPQAVQIIESGFLGYGFPIESQGRSANSQQLIRGVATTIPDTGIAGVVAGLSGNSNKASSLSVRMGYGDINADKEVAMTPWLFSIVTAPNISFGEDINITMKAVSTGMTLASSDTIRNFEGESLYAVITKIIQDDANGNVQFSSEARTRALAIKITGNQTDNSLAYVKGLLDQYNFKYFEQGGTEDNPKQVFNITTLSSITNSSPKFTLVMYGQIDIPNKIYPCQTFDSVLDHMLVAGAFHGQKVTGLITQTKEIKKTDSDVKEYRKDIKATGDTIQGFLKAGKPTTGGPTDGPPSLQDRKKAGKRKMAVQKNELDTEQIEAVHSDTKDAIDGSFSSKVTCPFIPEALPNDLIKFIIFSGNPEKPVLKSISGIYKILTVRHHISDSGGTTELDLIRGIGETAIESKNVQKVREEINNLGNAASPEFQSFIKGIYG